MARLRALLLCSIILLLLLLVQNSSADSSHRHQRPARALASPPSTPSRRPLPYSLASSTSPIPPSSPLHPSRGLTANLALDPAIDCALRAFAIDVVTARQPPTAPSNWTALAHSAFQMTTQCNTSLTHTPPSLSPLLLPPSPTGSRPTSPSECSVELFIDGQRGDDAAHDGSEASPFATLPHALAVLRTLRSPSTRACLTLRGGRHYLPPTPPTSPPSPHPSRVGGLHLTPADSNLLIRAYAGESPTLSGGVPLPASLNWTVHAKLPSGSIMRATLPPSLPLSLSLFNELYTDGVAATRAKYPNGNPYTHGLYSAPTGYVHAARSWLPPRPVSPATPIHIATPSRNGTHFQYFDLGVGGGAAVFDPPTNFWAVDTPTAGSTYGVPSGLVVEAGEVQDRMKGWGEGGGGGGGAMVHAFHSGYWGSWVFDVARINASSGEVTFGAGGFQEARGNRQGGSWYISNVLAELDEAGEWYLDAATRTLYYMPNATMPSLFVAAQRACLISMVGSQDMPVRNVTITGVTLTETTHTFMEAYEAPASGDWAIHRGGAVYLEGTVGVTVEQSLFTQVATNALVVSDYNVNVSVDANEFAWLGDSAVLVVGTTHLIDGVSTRTQPDRVTISRNLFHELGAYVKQSAPVFVALAREVLVTGNVAFNVPRSCVNINDGFAGNKTISFNAFFNSVRETSDHGPVRLLFLPPPQPHLLFIPHSSLPFAHRHHVPPPFPVPPSFEPRSTRGIGSRTLTEQAGGPGVPSLTPHLSYITRNALFNNYNSFYPIGQLPAHTLLSHPHPLPAPPSHAVHCSPASVPSPLFLPPAAKITTTARLSTSTRTTCSSTEPRRSAALTAPHDPPLSPHPTLHSSLPPVCFCWFARTTWVRSSHPLALCVPSRTHAPRSAHVVRPLL